MKCDNVIKEVKDMTQNTKKWIRRVYYALVVAALVVAAVCLMVQCVAIYRTGDKPFTRERIADHFAPIAVPIYVCLGLVAVGFALSSLLPAAPDSAPDRDAVTLRRLQRKTDLTACDADLSRAVCRQRRARNRHCYITLALLAVGSAIFLWYATNSDNFTDNFNHSMLYAMQWMIPCMGVPALYGIHSAYFSRRSVKKEIDLLRCAPKEAIVGPKAEATRKSEKWLPYLQGGVAAIAVGCIVYGLMDNGAAAVLAKAVNICTECIGLG